MTSHRGPTASTNLVATLESHITSAQAVLNRIHTNRSKLLSKSGCSEEGSGCGVSPTVERLPTSAGAVPSLEPGSVEASRSGTAHNSSAPQPPSPEDQENRAVTGNASTTPRPSSTTTASKRVRTVRFSKDTANLADKERTPGGQELRGADGDQWSIMDSEENAASPPKKKKRRSSLQSAGLVEVNGRKRSTRKKMKPLRWWCSERKTYCRKHESLPTVSGVVTTAQHNTPENYHGIDAPGYVYQQDYVQINTPGTCRSSRRGSSEVRQS